MKSLLLMLTTLVCTACAAYKLPPESTHGNRFLLKPFPEEVPYIGNDPEWGLALSGGGIRSSLFSIGVMKSLYDAGILQKISIISSASGGGYAAYWLLSSDYGDTNQVFGDNRFGRGRTLVNYCRLMTSGNYVPYMEIAKHPFKRHTMNQCAIERTYSGDIAEISNAEFYAGRNTYYDKCMSGHSEAPSIAEYFQGVEDKKIPYFIFNTTLADVKNYKPAFAISNACLVQPTPKNVLEQRAFQGNPPPFRNACPGWVEGQYQFTPLLSGNEMFGMKVWPKQDQCPTPENKQISPKLSKVVAIAGAALRGPLGPWVTHPHGDAIADPKIKLSDGGHSDNLGAMALIQRGVNNIIVVDAEMDEELTFEAYYILEDRLRAWGLRLENEVLSSRERIQDKVKWWRRTPTPEIKEGVFIARVYDENNNLVSTLHYIKMSLLGRVEEQLGDYWFSGAKARWENSKQEFERIKIINLLRLNSDIRYVAADKKVHWRNSPSGRVREVRTTDGVRRGLGEWRCDDLLDSGNRERFDAEKLIMEEAALRMHGDFKKDFPHFTTIDQSFYIDQSMAWIGLGYLSGKNLLASDAVVAKDPVLECSPPPP